MIAAGPSIDRPLTLELPVPQATDPLDVVRRTWWIVLAALVTSVLVAWVLTARQRETWRSTASLVVSPNSQVIDSVRDEIDALETLDRRSVVATLARLAKKKAVLEEAAEAAGVSARGHRIRTVVPPNTNIIELHVEGRDPDTCALLADAASTVASREAMALYRAFRMAPLDAADRPRLVSPNLQRNLLAGAAIGLVLGLFLAVSIDWLRRALASARASRADSSA